jgi:hypothetical protein
MPGIVNMPPVAELDFVNPEKGVTIPAVVMNNQEGCHVWWSVQQETGYEYFNLADIVGLGDTVLVTLEDARYKLGRLVIHYFFFCSGSTLLYRNSIKLLECVCICLWFQLCSQID